ncbi:c-type cytochrome biogenesis protein CcsB [Pedobacter duraquae]|uniref:Cytochrome c-type biogenesis protein CcsB n=1 Tax=Pedobacter duraquae TaxID=425511 RepID=A0A4R6IHP5_9SPHI|nr:c-type cytochrome biogenesis protein CcsB [Pedobacter duraquae]TDO20785.1 cytochrome c-type biogenesis protein CcsB [Pedobacter duraquae]
MNRITKILFSTRTMGTMLLIYAFSMAMATFVENDYGTAVAKALIYNCWWFELVMLILVINFIGNIKRYRLYQRKKIPLLVFHLAFVIIFIGGFITRYISYEGSMHIREGESSKEIVSDATFFKVQIGQGEQALAYDDVPAILISNRIPTYLKPFKKTFVSEYDYNGQRVKMKVVDFYARAQDSLIQNPSGKPTLHLVVLENGKRVNKYIPSGEVQLIQNLLISYNKQTPGAINIDNTTGSFLISSPYEGSYMIMATQERKTVEAKDMAQPFHLRSLYNYGALAFVVPELPVNGNIIYFEGDKKTHEHDSDLLKVEITTPTATDTVSFYGGRGMTNFQHQSEIGGLRISLAYGSKIYPAPFALKLTHFQMDKYPGSDSPAAYSSDIMIQDGGAERPYKIYMNHVLDHAGFRFFQASFDDDQKGTVLSVNHDELGTNVTYAGYTLLFLAMFVTLFWKGTHFSKLNEQLKSISKSKVALLLFMLLPLDAAFGQQIDMHGKNEPAPITETTAPHNHLNAAEHVHTPDNTAALDQLLNGKVVDPIAFAASVKIDPAHADLFGHLLVQNIDGRIEPVNTMALEILRKLHRKDKFYSLNANQFFLSISTRFFDWVNVPIIKAGSKASAELLTKIKADKDGYTSMINLLLINADGSATFILKDDYLIAFAKKPSDQNTYDKEVIDLNDKLQVMQQLMEGAYLRIFPIAGDANNTWIAMPVNVVAQKTTMPNAFDAYIKAVQSGQQTGNWTAANTELENISKLQHKYGQSVIPSEAKINWEVRYNSWNLFLNLMITYAFLGALILGLAFFKLFKSSKNLDRIITAVLFVITIAAVLQGIGLGVRWYISGHEPWSNGYEAVLFISWIGVLSGLLMYRNSNAFIPAAGCLIAVILMGFAHGGSQMNPQITPLVPVLKSYWLMIHVAIITSSYGFFGLSALIGTVVLILFIIDNNKISDKVKASITELSIVNEMSLTIGLFLLTVGTFLGGIWANESWGRYWSWDPKETWAFISVIIYAFILHVRLIPGLKSKYLFNLLSLIGFSTIIMTYFGVNYYLTGLHSYAKGDPVPVPAWVYIVTGVVLLLAIVSYRQRKKRLTKA